MFISSVMQDTITRFVSPEIVIAELNRYMNQLNSRGQAISYYFTAIYLLINVELKTIEYVNAGHPPGLLVEHGKVISLLDQGTCAVGFFEQAEINKGTVSFNESVEIVLYTDGLLEAIDDSKNDPLDTLSDKLKNYAGQDLASIIDQLLPPELLEIQSDDICLVRVTVS
jgi:sigma-B regulation protein RsbU (phosphoserine phosphatase)